MFLEVRQAQIEMLAAEKRVKLYRDTLLPQAEAAFKASTPHTRTIAPSSRADRRQNLLLEIQTAYYKALAARDAGDRAIWSARLAQPIPDCQQTSPGEEKQMTVKEKKLFALGAGAGSGRGACCWSADVEEHTCSQANLQACELNASPRTQRRRTPQQGTSPARPSSYPGRDYRGGRAGSRSAHRRLKTDIDAFGRVEQPEAQLAAVSARIGGRVDKLYVQYTGERVSSGQPVADIYSPEVATAIEEYRLAEENRNQLSQSDDAFARAQADALVKASQHRLELWGIAEQAVGGAGKMAFLMSPSIPMPRERWSIAK